MSNRPSQQPLKEFSNHTRQANIESFKKKKFDVLVLGAGITGCGIALDAALRGLSVALIDKGDFGGGTSSRSSKLIHGGLRYLEKKQFKLVMEAVRERDLLRKLAPHRVTPLAFLFPLYRHMRVGFLKMGAGMWLYDLLSLFRTPHMHKTYFSKALLKKEPLLNKKGLRGGFIFYDCFADDTRLTLDVAKAAHEEGAHCANYVKLLGFKKEKNTIRKAVVQDCLSHDIFDISATHFINATGPWSDITRDTLNPQCHKRLRPTKGIHLFIKKNLLPVRYATLMQAEDGRFVYLIPWYEHLIVGTTDTEFYGRPDDVHVTSEDISYLLKTTNEYFFPHKITKRDIMSSYAGVRPLVKTDSKDESSIPREHEIFRDASNFITIIGGKLTTYRKMAQEVVDLISSSPSKTSTRNFRQRLDQENDIDYTVHYEMTQTLCDFIFRRTHLYLEAKNQDPSFMNPIAEKLKIQLDWSETRLQSELTHCRLQLTKLLAGGSPQ